MTTPDWLVVGAEVGTYAIGYASRSASTARSTIDRIGKRDVVLADGQRFNVHRLTRSTSTWGPTTYLTTVDDPEFLAAEHKQQIDRDSRRVEALMQKWREGNDLAPNLARRILDGAA